MNKLIELQKIIFEYFKDIDDITFIEIVKSFVFDVSNPSKEASKLIEKFLKDNGLDDAFINYQYDKTDKATLFRRSSLSQSSMIENIKTSLLTASFNRFNVSVSRLDLEKSNTKLEGLEHNITKLNLKSGEEEHNITKLEVKLAKAISNQNEARFNYLKANLLECYSILNNNESYFDGKVEDSKFVAEVGEMTYEK